MPHRGCVLQSTSTAWLVDYMAVRRVAIDNTKCDLPAPIMRSPKITSRNLTITRTPVILFHIIHRPRVAFLALQPSPLPHPLRAALRYVLPSIMGRNHLPIPSIGGSAPPPTEFVRDRKFLLPFNSSATLSIKNRTVFCTELWSF